MKTLACIAAVLTVLVLAVPAYAADPFATLTGSMTVRCSTSQFPPNPCSGTSAGTARVGEVAGRYFFEAVFFPPDPCGQVRESALNLNWGEGRLTLVGGTGNVCSTSINDAPALSFDITYRARAAHKDYRMTGTEVGGVFRSNLNPQPLPP